VDKSVENQIAITNYFRKWISMNSDLVEMSANALVQPLLPLSQSLSDISVQILLGLRKENGLFCSEQFIRGMQR
jgi:hexosaminidase